MGSGLNGDPHHAFPDLVENFAGSAQRFEIPTKGPGGTITRTSDLYLQAPNQPAYNSRDAAVVPETQPDIRAVIRFDSGLIRIRPKTRKRSPGTYRHYRSMGQHSSGCRRPQ